MQRRSALPVALSSALALLLGAAGCDIEFTVRGPDAARTTADGGTVPSDASSRFDAAAPGLDAATEPADAATEPADAATEPADAATEPADAATEPADAATEPPDAATEPPDAATALADAAQPPDATAQPPDASALPDAACTDGVHNGTETDIDCGGSCGDCADCRNCGTVADCAAGACTSGVCGAAGTIRVRATYWSVADTWMRHVNVVLDCQNALNGGCAVTSGCSTTLGSDCVGTCANGQECWVATTYGAPSESATLDLPAALGCPHTVCLYPNCYGSYLWGGTLEVFDSGWKELASSTTLTSSSWLCASGVMAR